MDEKEDLVVDKQAKVNHDEAFKKLLQTFFKEFIELFFPELDRLLDHRQTRFLMQELLVDIVGEESRRWNCEITIGEGSWNQITQWLLLCWRKWDIIRRKKEKYG